jgi:geranylgeranyl diphosphate synthase, type II
MSQIKEISQFFEQTVQNFELPNEPKNLYQPLNYFFSLGGKRIRPLLTLLATDLFNIDYKKAIHGAMAIEFFHNFSLIHDDIMDEAPLRRKMPTVHQKWNNNIAILSGDVLLVKAYQELCKQEPRHLKTLIDLFNKTAIEVCEGQQMDMDFEKRNLVSIEEYIEMIRLKTSVLIGCSLQIGAIIADAGLKNQELIYQFGENLGIAFQIQDDLLDLFANPENFGKQVGGDIITDKKTILTLKAIELIGLNEYNRFKNENISLNNEEKVEKTKQFYAKVGVKKTVLELRNLYFQKAIESLNSIEVNETQKLPLFAIVEMLKEREV